MIDKCPHCKKELYKTEIEQAIQDYADKEGIPVEEMLTKIKVEVKDSSGLIPLPKVWVHPLSW